MNHNPQNDVPTFVAGDRVEVIKGYPMNLKVGDKGTITRVGLRPNGTPFADIKWDDGIDGYLYDALLQNHCKKI